MRPFNATHRPLEDLNDGAGLRSPCDHRPVCSQALSTQKRNMLPRQLQQISFFARLGPLRDDDQCAVRFSLHDISFFDRQRHSPTTVNVPLPPDHETRTTSSAATDEPDRYSVWRIHSNSAPK